MLFTTLDKKSIISCSTWALTPYVCRSSVGDRYNNSSQAVHCGPSRNLSTRQVARYWTMRQMVKGLATQRGETIVSHGAAAANALGLTTQPPMRAVYLTSGRSRRLKLDAQTVEFRHAPIWQLTGGNAAFRGNTITHLAVPLHWHSTLRDSPAHYAAGCGCNPCAMRRYAPWPHAMLTTSCR